MDYLLDVDDSKTYPVLFLEFIEKIKKCFPKDNISAIKDNIIEIQPEIVYLPYSLYGKLDETNEFQIQIQAKGSGKECQIL